MVAGHPGTRIIRSGKTSLQAVRTEVRRDEGRGVPVAVTVPRLEIAILGPFQVMLDGILVTDFGSDTARALLAYLALAPEAAHRRDALAGLLWPEVPNADALRNLRVTLSRLRDAIRDRDADPPFLDVTRKTIRWAGAPAGTVDAWIVRDAISATQAHNHEDLAVCDTCARRLQAATKLYRGDLLTGFALDSVPFEEWLVAERESIHWAVLEALGSLAQWHERRGELDDVIACARRQVELEVWREGAHRQWMRALAMRGQRAAALAQYEACRQALLGELGVAPEAITVKLRDDIRAGVLGPAGGGVAPATSGGAPVAVNVAGDHTGGPPPPASVSTDGEWRRVTVVASEITGGEPLRDAIGFEDWVWCMRDLLQVAGTELASMGGHPDRFDEESLVGSFGAVRAHEDDVERAVQAALAIQAAFEDRLSALAQLRPGWRDGLIHLDLRTAVDVGQAIVSRFGPAVGDGQVTVAGDIKGSVARLLDRVPPGTIGVSGDVRRLVEPLFQWEHESDEDDPGYHQPIGNWVQSGKRRGIAGMRSGLVGRAAEAQAIRSRVEELRNGGGGIITVVGEAGIGKSRLVAECRAAAGGAARWIEGRCLSFGGTVAYSLWASALRALIGVPDNASVSVIDRALRRTLGALVPDDPDASRPYLAHLLGLPQDRSVATTLAGMDVRARQRAVAYAVRRLLRAAAMQQPLVVVCEDLHWADASSLVLLSQLLSLVEEAPVLIVCVMRRLESHGSSDLRETALATYADRHTGIELEPLTSLEGQTLLENLLLSMPGSEGRATVDALPGELKSAILSRGEGNPFFVEEVLRSLIRSGAIRCDEDTCEWEAAAAQGIGIPETLYGVLQSRIDRLPAGARQVLQMASVVGRVFSLELLAAVAGRADLERHLSVLVGEQLIRERLGGPGPEYIFKHQLTLEATYEGLLQRVRRPLHRRVAEAIEQLYADRIEANFALLARHWELGGDVGRAISYLRRAGERAGAQYASIETEGYFDHALALVPRHDRRLRLDLLLARYDALRRRGPRNRRATRDTPEILRLAEELGERHRRADMLLRQAEYELSQGDDQGAQTACRAIELAREDGDGRTEAMGSYLLGWISSHEMGKDQAASDALIETAIQLCWENELTELGARISRRYAIILGFEDKFAAAAAAAERALKIWRRLGNKVEEGRAINVLGIVAAARGEYAASRESVEESLRLCRETGNRFDEGYALVALSLAHRGLGEYAEARETALAAEAILSEVYDTDTWVRVALGRAYLHLGCWDQALDQLTAAPGEPVGSDPYDNAWAYATMSQVWLRRGDPERAAMYGRLAVALPAHRPARRDFLPALGAALVELGELEEAYNAYDEAVAIWAEAGLPHLAVEAMAGAARVSRLLGDHARALALVERVLELIKRPNALGVAMEPLRVYLVCVRVLEVADDPRAEDVLREGYWVLMARAGKIEDPELRASYLAMPVHQEIIDELGALMSDGPAP